MVKASNDVKSALLKKGFRISDTNHTYFTYYSLAGKKTQIFTKMSHGPNHDINDYLIGQMARQCKISKIKFCSFIECHIDQSGYEELLPLGIIV